MGAGSCSNTIRIGDRHTCNNYRGKSLLSTEYKIYSMTSYIIAITSNSIFLRKHDMVVEDVASLLISLLR
jgi:hypothetical protein